MAEDKKADKKQAKETAENENKINELKVELLKQKGMKKNIRQEIARLLTEENNKKQKLLGEKTK